MANDRIGISAIHLNRLGASGANRYIEGIINAIPADTSEVVVYASLQGLSCSHPKQYRLVPGELAQPGTKANLLRLLWYQTALKRHLQEDNVSVIFSPLPEAMLFPCVKQVITIHDLLPLIFPADTPRLRHYYRYIVPRLIQASSAVIVDSESCRKDVEKYYAPKSTPIHVVYLGYRQDIFNKTPAVDVASVKEKYGLEDYILSVGELRPHKNFRRLVEAFLSMNRPKLQLAIVGKPHFLDPDIVDLPKMLRVSDRIKFLGFVADEELSALYHGANLFAYPSLNEGFGIPVAEAMACGVATVASNRSSIPEVGGDAANYFDPYDMAEIASVMGRVLDSPELQANMIDKGFRQAMKFNNKNTARQVLDVCRAIQK